MESFETKGQYTSSVFIGMFRLKPIPKTTGSPAGGGRKRSDLNGIRTSAVQPPGTCWPRDSQMVSQSRFRVPGPCPFWLMSKTMPFALVARKIALRWSL